MSYRVSAGVAARGGWRTIAERSYYRSLASDSPDGRRVLLQVRPVGRFAAELREVVDCGDSVAVGRVSRRSRWTPRVGWVVADCDVGGWHWLPGLDALTEIERASNPAERAVTICHTSPSMGTWVRSVGYSFRTSHQERN
jgi:hypothetical protein